MRVPFQISPKWSRAGPWLLLAACFAVFAAPVLDPHVQLFDRDASRLDYPFKAFIAARLRAGALPLWAPFTEAGTSLMGQVVPAVFHPLTVLYALLPVDLAFKLNHLLALPLAAIGMFLLARRFGASRWASVAAAAIFAGSGWQVSMTSLLAHYALGTAAIPLALAGLVALLQRPTFLRLLGGSAALALTMLAGEPQSALVCGLLGIAGAAVHVLRARPLRWRSAGLTAAWLACGLALSGPALLPAMAHLGRSGRKAGVGDFERRAFSLPPLRLAGLALPWAFDEQQEQLRPPEGRTPYAEYFADPPYTKTPFSTSIVLGVPALLLAAFSLRRRLGWALVGLGSLFALAAAGPLLPVDAMLRAVVPPLSLFRYAEKQIAVTTLLFALAAALGVDELIERPLRFAIAAAAAGLALLAGAAGLALFHDRAIAALLARAPHHAAGTANLFYSSLSSALVGEGVLAVALALIAAGSRRRNLAAFTACLCAGATVLQTRHLLFTAPADLFHGTFALAESLQQKAGPSPGNWRIDSDPSSSYALWDELDWRLNVAYWDSRALATQYNALAGIDTVAVYSSFEDSDYLRAWHAAPEPLSRLFGVRFSLRSPDALSPQDAAKLGFRRTPLGQWLRENAPQPRAFFTGRIRVEADLLASLAAPGFDPHAEALVHDGPALSAAAPETPVQLERPSPEQFIARLEAPQPGMVVFSEHFDPGWTATVDGKPAPVEAVDLVVPGVRVDRGPHRVELRFWPRGLTAGLWLSALTAAALAAAALRRRGIGRPAVSQGDSRTVSLHP